MNRTWTIVICVAACSVITKVADAQFFQPQMRKPAELIHKQEPLKVNQGVLKQVTPDNVHIVVSIPKQRAYLMVAEQIAADGPVSSGKRGHETPRGHFTVMAKGANHHSTREGA